MADDLVVNALKHKRKAGLTDLEIQQVSDLKKVYGIHNVLTAIQFSKTTSIKNVGRMLLQQCGFRSHLGESLKDVIPDKEVAKKLFSYEKFLAGCRLEEATKPIEPELEKHAKILWTQWKTKFSASDGNQTQVTYSLKAAIRNYGIPFVQMGIDVLSKTPQHAESELIVLFNGWLEVASTSSSSSIQSRLKEMGISPDVYNWKIPQPTPFRLEKYFAAKANRLPTHEEKEVLWSKSQKHKVEDIIHAISSIPSSEFSIEKVKNILSRNEPFGIEFVAAIKKKPAGGVLYEEEDDGDWEAQEDEYSEIQPPHDPMRDSVFYDYSKFDENALDGEDHLDDYLIDEED